MNIRLPQNPVARGALVYGGLLAALLIVTQLVFPGNPNTSGRGTPAAMLFSGLVLGLVVSLFATGVVLIYRTMRFINFALGPLGAIGAVLVSHLVVFTPVPFPVAMLLGIVLSAAVGAIFGTFLLRFFNASRLFLTVVTIVAAGFFTVGAITLVVQLPFWPDPGDRTGAQLEDLARLDDNVPFQGWDFGVGDFPLDFGFGHAMAIELAVLSLVGVGVFLRYTRAGTAVRAMAENPERASLLGIGVGSLSIVVWTIAGALDGMGAMLAATAAPGIGAGFTALLAPFAAAVFGRFTSIPTTVYAAVLIGVASEAWDNSFPQDSGLFDLILFGVIAVGLLLQRRRMGRSEAGAAVSWSATDESRPIPEELRGITGLRVARAAGLAVLGLLVVLLPYLVSSGRVSLAGVIIVNAIAVLSLVVLTGWAGQVSLGQFALVAVGSVVGGSLGGVVGFWLAVPLTVAITAGVAVVVGLPALRIRGLFLLVTTLAFAAAVQSTLFNERYFGWLLPEEVRRPTLFFVDFESGETAMYYLLVLGLVASIAVVVNLRRSRVGRVLIALRENEANVQAFGISPVRAKLLALAISGGLAGFAGVLFAHQARGVSAGSFTVDASVFVFVAAVIGGVASPVGALLGAAYFQLTNEFATSNVVTAAFFNGLGPLLIVFVAPGGFISLVNSVRDSVLRVVAQRRQIVVPSLFADYDPDILARRLIPLGEADTSTGLSALPPDRRFTLRSELYKGIGERIVDRLAPKKESDEARTIGAVAKRFEDEERQPVEVAP